MVLKSDIESVLTKYKSPRIGVIGGSYIRSENAELCESIGSNLREFIGDKGWLFTGGVGGVGVKVYRGVVTYSQQNKLKDRFFALLPRGRIAGASYDRLAEKISKIEVTNERCGTSWAERRQAMSKVGDVLIMVEGGGGTANEAYHAIRNHTPLISFYQSDGTSSKYDKQTNYVHPVDDVTQMLSVLDRLFQGL